jgi:hypothetical protein
MACFILLREEKAQSYSSIAKVWADPVGPIYTVDGSASPLPLASNLQLHW